MRVRRLFIFCLAAALVGCASNPEPKSYYRLAPPVVTGEESGPEDMRPTFVIESVDLAEYLRQSGLVIQSGENQLVISRTHLWAESLDEAVPKAMLAQLQQKSSDYRFYLKFSDYIDRTDYRLRLHIESLQATEGGEVVAAGRYQIVSSADSANPLSANFYFRQDLNADGYGHAVEQMQVLLGQIADAILESLKVMDVTAG